MSDSLYIFGVKASLFSKNFSIFLKCKKDRTGQPWGYWLAGSGGVSCFFKRFPAVCAGYIDLAGCPDNGAAAGADIFDAPIDGFLASAFGDSGWL